MSERLPAAANPFSAMASVVMILIGTIAFIAIFGVMAWSPELANKDRAGEHPYSKSALGYASLVKLLEADGQTVSISRLESTLGWSNDLLIVTIPEFGFRRTDSTFDLEEISQPALYVLPKWSGFADRSNPNWQKDTDLLSRQRVQSIASRFDSDLNVWRLRNPGQISTPFVTASPNFEHRMQVLESDSLESIIQLPGGTLLAKVPGSEIYILSDPDLFNSFGLSRRENARLALGLIDSVKEYPGQNITFDATLHGFARSESLLRAVFDAPFMGASLIAFATMILMGWSAMVRFAPPLREERVLSFGKKALAESSAGLVSMARREDQMAQPYLNVTERALARDLSLPENTSGAELARTLDRIAEQSQLPTTWTDQAGRLASPTSGRNELRDKALAIWRWRQEIKNAD